MAERRLRRLRENDLDDLQRALWKSILDGPRGAGFRESPESLGGPFDAWLRSPAAGLHASALGEELRFRGAIEGRLRELAIITVATRWRAEFEFYAHAALARREGLGEDVIEAIRSGARAPFRDEDERLVHAFAEQLVSTGRVDDEMYGRASARFGDEVVVGLVMLIGYYSLVSFTLNAFEVALPPGVPPVWSAAEEAAEQL